MLNTYDLFVTRVVHGKLPIQIDLHKKIKFFVDNNYLEEDKVSCPRYNPPLVFSLSLNGRTTILHPVG